MEVATTLALPVTPLFPIASTIILATLSAEVVSDIHQILQCVFGAISTARFALNSPTTVALVTPVAPMLLIFTSTKQQATTPA